MLTLAVVSPRDGGAVVASTVEKIETKRAATSAQPQQFAEDPVMFAAPTERDMELAAQEDPIFGDYGADESETPVADQPAPAPAAPPRMLAQARPFRPGGPIGGPVKADGPGIVVPHSDDAREAAASRQIPVMITPTGKSAPQ